MTTVTTPPPPPPTTTTATQTAADEHPNAPAFPPLALDGRGNFYGREPRGEGNAGRRFRATSLPTPFAAGVGGLARRRFGRSTCRRRLHQEGTRKRDEADAIEWGEDAG